MIKIQIHAEANNVADSFESENTTLLENSLALRRLEEAKAELLKMKYKETINIREKKK